MLARTALVSLFLRPSLHAAARKMEVLLVTLAALYEKVNRTEPAILRALVRGSAERLAPVTAAVDSSAILPGWRLRVLDRNHLPTYIGAQQIAALYRTHWCIEGMFQRLEGVLRSEVRSLGHPRAALLGFAVAVLAYNVLALLQRCVEQAHQDQGPPPEGFTYHLALHIRIC